MEPPVEQTDTIVATLAERGARYGDFTDHARVAQRLQDDMRAEPGWERCDAVQKQALTVIADKIARVLTGDPNYDDNWRDMQGYARLVEERLPDSKITKTTSKETGNWNTWFGGERPLYPDTPVQVEFKNGDNATGRAKDYAWSHHGNDYDIVAYKVV